MAEIKSAPKTPDEAAQPQTGTASAPVTNLPGPPEPAQLPGDNQAITWTASEFVAHDKSAGWYVVLAIVVLLLATLILLLTKDKISVITVIVAGLLIGIYGSRKPRQLEYRIDQRGIGIGQKHFGYEGFRSFSIVPEGAFSSIVFMPLKRFALPATVYYAPDDEEKIIAVLSRQLPFETYKHDFVESLMRRIRF